MKLINVSTPKYPLTFAKVDDEDFEVLSQFKWSAHKAGKTMYAMRNFSFKKGGKRGVVRMHQSLLPKAEEIDHVNHDGLDNRKTNLRSCTHAQNMINRRKRRSRSQFKGVTWHKAASKWMAQVHVGDIHKYLGLFDCEGCAAIAYDKAAKEMHGEFSSLNFL